jgi:hypothetical protein
MLEHRTFAEPVVKGFFKPASQLPEGWKFQGRKKVMAGVVGLIERCTEAQALVEALMSTN